MESFVKSLTSAASLSGFILAVLIIATVGLGWIKMMRELMGDKDDLIEQKDRELADFRREKGELTARVVFFTKRLAEVDTKATKMAGLLYWKDKYIGKLEHICTDHALKLPVNGDSDGD